MFFSEIIYTTGKRRMLWFMSAFLGSCSNFQEYRIIVTVPLLFLVTVLNREIGRYKRNREIIREIHIKWQIPACKLARLQFYRWTSFSELIFKLNQLTMKDNVSTSKIYTCIDYITNCCRLCHVLKNFICFVFRKYQMKT